MSDAGPVSEASVPVKKAKPPRAEADYAHDILQKLEREPGDRVTCVRVFNDFYRCNWWAPAAGPAQPRVLQWLIGSADRVRKSQFVRATLSEGHLVIEDATLVAEE